jgi:hypothetical protein
MNAYIFLLIKTKGRKLLGRPRHRWKDNIKIDLTEAGCQNVELDTSGSG